jgi:hypothetical protein
MINFKSFTINLYTRYVLASRLVRLYRISKLYQYIFRTRIYEYVPDKVSGCDVACMVGGP